MGKLFKLLAVSNALAMALPLGWCCPTPADAAQSETASARGCPNCQPQRAAEDERVPAAPDSPEKCPCCQVRATTAGDQVSSAPAAEGWTVIVATVEPAASWNRGFEPTEFVYPPGPSLQILHCVWRC